MNKILTKNLSRQNILVDNHGRTVNYLRLSVTDRCNYRCTYCMPEKMKFSFVKHYLTISGNEFIKDKQIAEIKKISPDSLLPIINDDTNYLWVTDIAGHLGQRAIVDFSNKIYNHIIENNLLD